jgi:3-methyladenine DNA glycosylase AlkD
METKQVITLLRQKSNPTYLTGMKRFAIDTRFALGISVPELRKIAKEIKTNHTLAFHCGKQKPVKSE